MSVIGLDLGGTNIKGGLFRDGKLVKSLHVPSGGKESREAILFALKKIIHLLDDGHLEKIGLASAGEIDVEKGSVKLAVNLVGWTGCPVKAILEEEFHLPVYVDNDAVGALVGELSLYPEEKNVVMLTFGTGVGGACLVNGQIDRTHGLEIGHMELMKDGRECFCGKKGCAERYLSVSALTSDARKVLPTLAGSKQLISFYNRGNPKAVAVMCQYGKWLNLYLQKIDEKFHPSLIILGGGLMNAKETIKGLISFPTSRYAFSELGDNAGVVGASLFPYQGQ
jgi:glucokinase